MIVSENQISGYSVYLALESLALLLKEKKSDEKEISAEGFNLPIIFSHPTMDFLVYR